MINTETLKKWIKRNNIESRSIERFWEYINMYIEEIEDETSNTLKYMDFKLVKVNLYKVSLSIIYDRNEVINVFLDILYGEIHIGRYEIVYTISAEFTDEFLVFDDISYIMRLTDTYNKTTDMAKLALQEGLDINIVSRITRLSLEQVNELKG